MSTTETIKKAFERTEQAMIKKPSLGQRTGKVTVRSTDGLACEIESGPWKFRADMPKPVGGDETAPTPGVYEAAALGSCMVIMVRMWAAKMDVPIDALEIDVEFDADKRCLFGIANVPARWKAIRYHIVVESTAPESSIMHILDMAHKQSHVRGDFEYPFKVERKLTIKKTVQQEA